MSRVTALYMDQAPVINNANFRFVGKGSISHSAAGLAARNTFGHFYSRHHRRDYDLVCHGLPIPDRAGTMMEQDEFRALALTFPEAVESSHFDTADFRVRNKIFATLREADGRAVLKLSPDEQQLVMATSSGLFEPIKGSWGLKGWTRVILDRADIETVRHAMGMAWRSVAPRKLRADDAVRHRGH
jgi:hypothetical protein